MALGIEPLKFIRRWVAPSKITTATMDYIVNTIGSWGTRVDNNLKQIGLDLNGDTYKFNNIGRATQSSSIISRLDAVEVSQSAVGVRNLGLDTSATNVVKLLGNDGTNLSSSNIGYATFSSATAGRLTEYEISANLSVTLTGAHWGFDTFGDLTDVPLYVILIDTGSAVVLGVTAQGGRDFISSTDIKTTASSVTSRSHVLTSAAVGADANCIDVCWLNANFDDTGNAGGENYWTIQTGKGDVNFGQLQSLYEGTFTF